MQTLRLAGNRVGDAGAAAIAAALPRAPHVLALGLASNQIGDKGALALAEIHHDFPRTAAAAPPPLLSLLIGNAVDAPLCRNSQADGDSPLIACANRPAVLAACV